MTKPEPAWARRFRSVEHDFPAWSPEDPDLLTLVSNRGGSRQVWTHRLRDGSWSQVSDEPIGVDGQALVLPDGPPAWWRDTTGDERGSLVTAAPDGAPRPVFPELPEGWPTGIAFAADRAALTIEVGGTYTTYVIGGGGSPRILWATPFASWSMPRSSARRASSSKLMSFGAIASLLDLLSAGCRLLALGGCEC